VQDFLSSLVCLVIKLDTAADFFKASANFSNYPSGG